MLAKASRARMPDMDGAQALRRQPQTRHVRCFALSADAASSAAAEAGAAGFVKFWPKPPTGGFLSRRLRALPG